MLCTGDDMLYANEGGFFPQAKLKFKPPYSSYEITSNITKDSTNNLIVNFKPTKSIFLTKDLIPNWINATLYSLRKTSGKRINVLHLENKSLRTNNHFILEPCAILYCHDNETDLIRILPLLIDFSIQLKCDIISFDYMGFGHSKEKVKKISILEDGEETIKFSISVLNYKIENIIIMGQGIGCMTSIHLASINEYHYCKVLILCSPVFVSNAIDIKIMRSIVCKCLVIMESDNKDDLEDNEAINLCREILNEKEWIPSRKKKLEDKFIGFKAFMENTKNDVYAVHRRKFILKIRDYILSDEEEKTKMKKKQASSCEDSTQLETNSNVSLGNKNINFDDGNDNKKIENIDEKEIKLNNNDDY